MKKSITIATLLLTTALTANAGLFSDNNNANWGPFDGGSNMGPFNGMSNMGPFNGGNNWLNDTDFGFNFNTKNKVDNTVSGKAVAKLEGQADGYAKGYADAKNDFYQKDFPVALVN
jgi:hypothetical protein